MNLFTVRNALKAAIATIEGLNVDNLRPSPNVPCCIVMPDTPYPYDMDFEGEQFPKFRLLTLVPYVNTASAQDQLDLYLSTEGPQSIKVAVEQSESLKAIVSSAEVSELSTYGVMQLLDGGTEYLSGEQKCELYTKDEPLTFP